MVVNIFKRIVKKPVKKGILLNPSEIVMRMRRGYNILQQERGPP